MARPDPTRCVTPESSPPLVMTVEQSYAGSKLSECNIEINDFVLQKIRWIWSMHPSAARLDNFGQAVSEAPPAGSEADLNALNYDQEADFELPNDLPDEAIRVKRPQKLSDPNFDPFAFSNPLSCRDMFITRPPIQALKLKGGPGETSFGVVPPYIFSPTGITVRDLLFQFWEDTLYKRWAEQLRRPVFVLSTTGSIKSLWDYAEVTEEDKEAAMEYHYPSDIFPFQVVPSMRIGFQILDEIADENREYDNTFTVVETWVY